MIPTVKGYVFPRVRTYVLGNPALCARLPPSRLEALRRNEPSWNTTDWRPRQELTDLLALVADTAPDEATAYADVVECGVAVGRVATSTFLKLLFKLLTPQLLVSKVPDFWRRDHQQGYIAIEVNEPKRAGMWFRELHGYPHLAPFAHGWVANVLTQVGARELTARCTPWSRAAPAADDVYFQAQWQ